MKRMAAVRSALSAGLERLRSEPDSAFVTASDLATRAGISAEAASRCLRREASRPDGSVRRKVGCPPPVRPQPPRPNPGRLPEGIDGSGVFAD